jgi:heme-degrading monooxygenase HmoA
MTMILEAAVLDVTPGREIEFEQAFAKASPLIAARDAYLGHSLRRCLKSP